jgi:hypothetical protein
VIWRITDRQKRIPIDPEPVVGGNIELVGRDGVRFLKRDEVQELRVEGAMAYQSHFVSCPHAQEHRRR